MNNSKIDTSNAIFLTLSIVVSYITSSLPKTFVNELKTATLLNIIYITIIVLFIIILFCKLFEKFPGLDILDISQYIAGKWFKKTVGFLFIFYFIVSSSIMLRNFTEGLDVVYYPLTNHIYIILLFIIATAIASQFDFSSTINSCTIIFPIVFLSALFLFCGNWRNYSFRNIYPILGNGPYTTFISGLKNIGAFGGICYLYFLSPMLKKPEKMKKIAVISVISTGGFLLLCSSCLLFLFSNHIEINEIMPLFLAARFIEFGTFFQRFESVFLLIWIISFCCYLTISCKFATHIMGRLFNFSDSKPLSIMIVLLIFSISLIPNNNSSANFFETNIYRYLRIFIGYILGISVLMLGNIKKKVGDHNK